jgi:hypothetical protein
MRRRLNFAQRVVVAIGLALVLSVVGDWLTGLGSRVNFGWVAYAPLSNSFSAGDLGGLHPWVRMAIWLILITLWVVASVALLRTTPASLIPDPDSSVERS